MALGIALSVTAALVWSLVNIFDKVIISRYIRRPFVLMTVASFISLAMGVIVVSFLSDSLPIHRWPFVLVSGLGYNLGNLLYFAALKREESSRIVPLFSFNTVFIAVFGALFLNEHFTILKYFGIGLVVLGSWVLISRKSVLEPLRSRTLFLVICSVLSYSTAIIFYSYLLLSYSPITVFGYHELAQGLFFFVFLFIYWSQFKEIIMSPARKFIIFPLVSETCAVSATLLFIAAVASWYATLASAVVTVQYIFLFLLTVMMSRFKPQYLYEEMTTKVIFQKFASIAAIIVGIVLISI